MPIDDIDRFEQKELKRKRFIKDALCDWLINYIPVPIRKTVSGYKDKVVSFSENFSKKTVGHGKKLSKLKIQKESEEYNIIRNIRNLFRLKKENEAIKYRIFKDFLS